MSEVKVTGQGQVELFVSRAQLPPIDPFPIIGFYLYHVISADESNIWTTSGI